MHPIISKWYNTVLDPIISRLVLLKDCFLAMACGVVWVERQAIIFHVFHVDPTVTVLKFLTTNDLWLAA